mmetsp:Transcript_1827/g.3458  ORF Transcript_1827/g.3458 Transcript_1827/m.3458 type:complete len:602 (-) Transcript_1827:23-1828(-)
MADKLADKLEAELRQVRHLYEDNSRLLSDLKALFRHVVTLLPQKGTFSSGGRSVTLFYLVGVLPISYKGNTYNIPVTFYFDPPYPKTAPRCFVTPTADMAIKSGHQNVEPGGMIYMPYLSNWSPSSSLIVLVREITSIFESNPPVYSTAHAASPASFAAAAQSKQSEQEERPSFWSRLFGPSERPQPAAAEPAPPVVAAVAMPAKPTPFVMAKPVYDLTGQWVLTDSDSGKAFDYYFTQTAINKFNVVHEGGFELASIDESASGLWVSWVIDDVRWTGRLVSPSKMVDGSYFNDVKTLGSFTGKRQAESANPAAAPAAAGYPAAVPVPVAAAVAAPAPAAAAASANASGSHQTSGRRDNKKRWGEGLEAPQAGARDFFPTGWVPQKDWRDAIATFGHSAAELDELSTAGNEIAEVFEEAYEAKVRGDSMAAVYSYTQENPHDVYGNVNFTMRSATKVAEVKLKRYRDYIYHLGQGLDCFPNYVGKCYRGIGKRFPEELYAVGSTVTWQPFSSATRKLAVTQDFLKEEGTKLIGSLFILDVNTAKDIEVASAFPDEEEVLLRYNTFMKVEGKIVDEADKKAMLRDLSAYNLEHLDVYHMRQL